MAQASPQASSARALRRRMTFVGHVIHNFYSVDKAPIIHAVMEFDEQLDLAKLRALCQEEVLQYPRFASRVSSNNKYWEPVDVDLSKHVTELELPAEGEEPSAAVQRIVGERMLEHFDPARPMWTATVLRHAPSGTSFLHWRISHSIGDGITLASLLMSLGKPTSQAGTAAAAKKPTVTAGAGAPARWGGKASVHLVVAQVVAAVVLSAAPAALFLALADDPAAWARALIAVAWILLVLLFCEPTRMFLVGINKINMLTFGPADVATPVKARTSKLGPRKVFARAEALPVAELKAVAAAAHGASAPAYGATKAAKVTVNDVVMAMVGGGVRRYAQAQGHRTGSMRRLRVRFLTIVNMRAARGLKDTQKMLNDYKTARFGNEFGYYMVPLECGELASLERVKLMHKELAYLKRSPEAWLVNELTRLLWKMLGARAVRWVALLQFSKLQTFVSNLMAPQHELSFAGSTLRGIYNCTAPVEFGCTFNMLSYNGKLVVASAADANHVPDPAALLRCVVAEFRQMQKDAAAGKPVALGELEDGLQVRPAETTAAAET
eukprot:g3454.t1